MNSQQAWGVYFNEFTVGSLDPNIYMRNMIEFAEGTFSIGSVLAHYRSLDPQVQMGPRPKKGPGPKIHCEFDVRFLTINL